MPRRSVLTKVLAVLVSVAVSGVVGPVLAAPDSASLAGHVLATDSLTPLAGVTVHVGQKKTGRVLSSAPTGADGGFSVGAIPPGTYEIAVQSGETVYPVNVSVPLEAGEARDIQIAVNQQVAPPPGPTDEQENKKGAAAWWNNPLTATLIVLGAAVLIGIVVDSATDDDAPASPSNP